MNLYYVGDRLVLGKSGEKPLPAGRVEALRPDGSRVTRDWGKGPWQVKLDQPGNWIWRLYLRDGVRTVVEEGEIEVLPAPPSSGLLSRLLRRPG